MSTPTPTATVAPSALERALADLEGAVRAPEFALVGAEQGGRRALQGRLADDVHGHLARLADLDAPLLVVFGGVTGAGKSTAVNTLLGRALVATGVLRPTTYAPTLVCNPVDARWFDGDRILPGLARAHAEHDVGVGGKADRGVLRVVHDGALPQGLALVDAPDIDSISDANRDLADALLDAADVWLWFTTAGKYADEESMRYLRRAAGRRTALAVALTQVRPADAEEILPDFRAKLATEGLDDVELFVVPTAEVLRERLPDGAVADLRAWLVGLAAVEVRRARRRQTLEGALDALTGEVGPLLDALADERRTVDALARDADAAATRARRDFAEALEEGLPLHREVLDRWNRFVGTGRFLRLAEQASGQARNWIRDVLANSAQSEEQRLERAVRIEVGDTLADLMVQLEDLAAAATVDAWLRDPGGRELTLTNPDLARSAPGLRAQAEAQVRAWQDDVVQLVSTKGAERKSTARWASTAVNAAATGAIVLALAHTGGLTGVEAGIATAAGAANQTLLVKLLGEANIRWLVGEAKRDLLERFDLLAADERRRFAHVLADAAPDPEQVEALEGAVDAVAAAR